MTVLLHIGVGNEKDKAIIPCKQVKGLTKMAHCGNNLLRTL